MKKILIVNPDQTPHEWEEILMERGVFLIFTALSCTEALRIHREERVDLIIADLHMPDLDGDRLCTLIRKESRIRNVSIILLCADSPQDLERVTQSSANAYITKPIDPEQLFEKTGQLLAVSARTGYHVLLNIRAHGETDTATFFCTSHNISATGILIETEKFLSQGERITCAFFLPGSHQIVADGAVVRTVKKHDGLHQYGVRFLDLTPEIRDGIERFVATANRLG